MMPFHLAQVSPPQFNQPLSGDASSTDLGVSLLWYGTGNFIKSCCGDLVMSALCPLLESIFSLWLELEHTKQVIC